MKGQLNTYTSMMQELCLAAEDPKWTKNIEFRDNVRVLSNRLHWLTGAIDSHSEDLEALKTEIEEFDRAVSEVQGSLIREQNSVEELNLVQIDGSSEVLEATATVSNENLPTTGKLQNQRLFVVRH